MPLNSAMYYRRMGGLPFAGRSDKYLSRRQVLPLTFNLEDALEGIYPYDVTGVALNEAQRDTVVERLHRYKEAHDFYKGNHFAIPIQDGERKTVFNFCKVVADKAVDWHVAKGWSVTTQPGNEGIAEYLNMVWEHNKRMSLSLRQAQFGAITGDSFIYVTARTRDQYGIKLPRKKWSVRLQVLDPAHVFPIWSDVEPQKMKACLIQMPVQSTDLKSTDLLTIWITSTRIQTWANQEMIDDMENPLGEVNVIHIPNFESADSAFGQSDIEDIIPVNEEYNLIAHSTRRIIKYHAEPTTVIYGVRASQLEKGANSVWSGLPTDAKVENLQLQSELTANFEWLLKLRELISQLSNTPKMAFDGTDSIPSNVSAAVLELTFQPLLEKTRRRQIPHRIAVQEINRLIIKVEETIIGNKLEDLADDSDNLADSDVTYTTPLPRDEAAELDLNIKKENAGVISRAELIRKCSNVANKERLVLELLADKRASLSEAYENQRAANGERPNSLVAFLGSEIISQDVMTLMKEIAVLEKLAGDKTDAEVKKEKKENTPPPAPAPAKPKLRVRISSSVPKKTPPTKVVAKVKVRK